MTSILIDTNALLDVIEIRAPWNTWAVRELAKAAEQGRIVINQIVYAEASVPYVNAWEFDLLLSSNRLVREELPWEACFIAGKTFLEYRRRGGERRANLPDFFIGAHAQVKGYRLMTRDPARYRNYFPDVALISPAE